MQFKLWISRYRFYKKSFGIFKGKTIDIEWISLDKSDQKEKKWREKKCTMWTEME